MITLILLDIKSLPQEYCNTHRGVRETKQKQT